MKTNLTPEQINLLRYAVSVANSAWFDSAQWHELKKIHDILDDATEITVEAI